METKIKTDYTICETNLERQHLLADFLNPLSLKSLVNIKLPQHANILDVGCGLGDTSLMLANHFKDAHITGLDANDELMNYASLNYKKHKQLKFINGDALHLPFNDNSFDFVFTRYVIQHINNPIAAIKEMKRVCKPGGIVYEQEPDANSFQTFPDSWAYPKFKEIINILFADALLGRKLIYYFTSLRFENIQHDAQIVLADHPQSLKKFYTMTVIAMGDVIMQKQLMTEKEFKAWVTEMDRLEHDTDTILLNHPTIAVWGRKTV